MILLDTSVLSRAFRRRRPSPSEARFRSMIEGLLDADVPIGLPGIVLQEVLSGIRSEADCDALHDHLVQAFHVVRATAADHVEAARIRNRCLARGANVSGIDCLIAAQAIGGSHELLAQDGDFALIARHAPLRLFSEFEG